MTQSFCARRMLGITSCVALLTIGHAATAGTRCYQTGGQAPLEVCHDSRDESIFFKPSRLHVSYNVQILQRSLTTYTTILHSEPQDALSYFDQTGRRRPGDSIKVGTVDAQNDPQAALTIPPVMNYRIWGSTTDTRSLLYYGMGVPNASAVGVSGGGNPMVISGLPGDPYSYVFFLGVSDFFHYRSGDWHDVLLEARTKDFVHFDVLTGHASWAAFTGGSSQVRPEVVVDASGAAIISNHAARPSATYGLFGSLVREGSRYYYFYVDQDPSDPNAARFYYRTATNVSTNGAWSTPTIIAEVPVGAMVRVAKSRTMQRWVVAYTCGRKGTDISDICVQYTETMKIAGPGGLSSLQLYQAPGQSVFYLQLIGGNSGTTDNRFLKAQHFWMTDLNGALAAPDASGKEEGILTWMDYPTALDATPYGATTYIAKWTVSPE